MFVASRVYNYATGANTASGSTTASSIKTPANSRVKRHPRKVNGKTAPLSYASVAAGESTDSGKTKAGDEHPNAEDPIGLRSPAELAKIAIIDEIVSKDDLYEVLGVKRNAKSEDIRRGFLNRSRTCHPDKLPNYEPCVYAFQKVSFAYQTLSKPSSRRMYDVSGRSDLAAALNEGGSTGENGFDANGLGSDETLNGVLYSVFCEFLEGDFEMIRVLVNALNEGNPGLDLGDEAVDSIEGAFRRLRELMLAGKKYLSVIRFELIRLYEIQHSLRQLSYFDIFGRLRLTLQLARVTLSIPMAIDQAMKDPEDEADGEAVTGDKQGDRDEDEAAPQLSESNDDSSGNSTCNTLDDDEGGASHYKSSRRRPRRRRRHHHRHRREHTTAANEEEEEFGMRPDDEDDDEDDQDETQHVPDVTTADDDAQRHSSRRSRRHARIKERQRAKLEAKEAQSTLQRRGLLGPTAAGLLKGVVKVLETSESWVPGGGGASDRPAS